LPRSRPVGIRHDGTGTTPSAQVSPDRPCRTGRRNLRCANHLVRDRFQFIWMYSRRKTPSAQRYDDPARGCYRSRVFRVLRHGRAFARTFRRSDISGRKTSILDGLAKVACDGDAGATGAPRCRRIVMMNCPLRTVNESVSHVLCSKVIGQTAFRPSLRPSLSFHFGRGARTGHPTQTWRCLTRIVGTALN